MDSRLDVFAALGLREGDAHILRNAGGVITDDVIRSIAVSQRRLGTRSVMLIHHTDCGMQKLTDDGFRAELQEATGVAPAFAIESFTDLDADVRQSILRVRRSEFILHRDRVRGFVYDVDAHRLRRSPWTARDSAHALLRSRRRRPSTCFRREPRDPPAARRKASVVRNRPLCHVSNHCPRDAAKRLALRAKRHARGAGFRAGAVCAGPRCRRVGGSRRA